MRLFKFQKILARPMAVRVEAEGVLSRDPCAARPCPLSTCVGHRQSKPRSVRQTPKGLPTRITVHYGRQPRREHPQAEAFFVASTRGNHALRAGTFCRIARGLSSERGVVSAEAAPYVCSEACLGGAPPGASSREGVHGVHVRQALRRAPHLPLTTARPWAATSALQRCFLSPISPPDVDGRLF